jgi:LAGLIDADG endonuclease
MVYAMMSIGVLGFVVWSWFLASPYTDIRVYINIAVCWNSLMLIGTLNGENSISLTKSASNLSLYWSDSNIQSASETIRDKSFNFSIFRLYYNTLFKNGTQHLTNNWLTWFIGFVEGDGAIQTFANGTIVRFVLTQKECDILYYIQKMFRIGTVKHFPQGTGGNKNDFYRWIVDDPSHILLLAFLFNGNLVITHRIKQLTLWVKALNLRFGVNTIIMINTAVSVTLQDAWLSGFTDAEGCFNVSITVNTKYLLDHVIKMRYILDQKDSFILNNVQNLFGFGKVTLRSETKGVYRYTATGFKSMNNVISYFKVFPLLTKKALSFDKWLMIHNIVSNKLHLSEEGLAKVRALQKQININNSMTNKTGSAHP